MEHIAGHLKDLSRPWALFSLLFGLVIVLVEPVAAVWTANLAVAAAVLPALWFVASGVASLDAAAQDKKDRDWQDRLDRADRRVSDLQRAITESESQYAKIYEVLEDWRRLWLIQGPDHGSAEEHWRDWQDAYSREGRSSENARRALHLAEWASDQATKTQYPPDPHWLQTRMVQLYLARQNLPR